MKTKSATAFAAILVAMSFGAAGAAKADCESDLVTLENAYKTPALSPDARKALDAAKVKAVRALKTDDDKTCHEAVSDGLRQAGVK
ncbi:MAG: hypothetical protein KGM42_21590 [Hyphomicrobiales bacterium]|nr:hypothetical protein [Hyphomicrobiales bacterium]